MAYFVRKAYPVTTDENDLPFVTIAAPGPGQPLSFYHKVDQSVETTVFTRLTLDPNASDLIQSIRADLDDDIMFVYPGDYKGSIELMSQEVLNHGDGSFSLYVGTITYNWGAVYNFEEDPSKWFYSFNTLYPYRPLEYEYAMNYYTYTPALQSVFVPGMAITTNYYGTYSSLAELAQNAPLPVPSSWNSGLDLHISFSVLDMWTEDWFGNRHSEYTNKARLVLTGFTI